MKNIQNKILSFVLSGAILAAGGIALASGSSLSASAEEGISPAVDIIVSAPKHNAVGHYTLVQHSWTGDPDGYMIVGCDSDPQKGQTTVANSGSECVYYEVQVPSVGSTATSMYNWWAQSYYKEADGTVWSSSKSVDYGTYTSKYPVTGSIVNQTAAKNEYIELSISTAGYSKIYFSLAHGGEIFDCEATIADEVTVTKEVGSQMFEVIITPTKISLRCTTKKMVFPDGSDALKANAFAYYLE